MDFPDEKNDPYYVQISNELTAINDELARRKKKPKKKPRPVPAFDDHDSGMSADEVEGFPGYTDEEPAQWSTYKELSGRDDYDDKSALGWLPADPVGIVVQVKSVGQVHYGYIERFVKTKYRIQTADSIMADFFNVYQSRLAVVAVAGKMQRVDVSGALMPPPAPKKRKPPAPPDEDSSSEEEEEFVPDRPQRERKPSGFYTEPSLSPSMERGPSIPIEPDTVSVPALEDPIEEDESKDETPKEDELATFRHDKRTPKEITVAEMAMYQVPGPTNRNWYCQYCDYPQKPKGPMTHRSSFRAHLSTSGHIRNVKLARVRENFKASQAEPEGDNVTIESDLTRMPSDLPDSPYPADAGPDAIPPEPVYEPMDFGDAFGDIDPRGISMDTAEREEDAADIEDLEERLERIMDPTPDSEDDPILPAVDPDWPTDPPDPQTRIEERGGGVMMAFGVAFAFLVLANYIN